MKSRHADDLLFAVVVVAVVIVFIVDFVDAVVDVVVVLIVTFGGCDVAILFFRCEYIAKYLSREVGQ